MSTTSRVNGSNNIWAALNIQRNPHQSKTVAKLDTNQDGVVSEMERMVGELREALAGLKSGDANSATAANQKIAELAQKIYAQVAQNLPDNSAPGLSVTA